MMLSLILFLLNGFVVASTCNNFVILVSSSNYFRNYRHTSNILSMRRFLVEHGVPDDHIITMIAGNVQCNARNSHYGQVHSSSDSCDLTENIRIDYYGEDVSLDSFFGVLTNKLPSIVPPSRRILPNRKSRVLVLINGHGGDDFFKFREKEELNSRMLYKVFYDMYRLGRYGELLVMIDTCQASSLIPSSLPPHSMFIASSSIGEESYSYGYDDEIAQPVEDRFIHQFLSYLSQCSTHQGSISTAQSSYLSFSHLQSHCVIRNSEDSNTTNLCLFFSSLYDPCLNNRY